jgi:hypothetical protein
MDSFMADALTEKLDYIERIDRLTTIAESRRNASLNEIDRRCSVKDCDRACKRSRTPGLR